MGRFSTLNLTCNQILITDKILRIDVTSYVNEQSWTTTGLRKKKKKDSHI